MAGVRIEISADTNAAQRALQTLIAKLSNLRAPLQDIGEELLASTEDRFHLQRNPRGSPWAPLNPAYRKRKAKNKDKILTLEGLLRGTLRWQLISNDTLRIGSDRAYAATHQYGDPKRNIPARPYLGLSPTDRGIVLAIFRRHLSQAA